MNIRLPQMLTRSAFALLLALVAGFSAVVAWSTRGLWQSAIERSVSSTTHASSGTPGGHEKPATGGTAAELDHGHDHDSDHDSEPENVLHLSAEARANLGLRIGEVELTEYSSEVVIPGVVMEEPGHCERRITSPINGIVTEIYAFPGQSVRPGDRLVDLQPTGDVLIEAQSSLLKTVKNLELAEAELKRLTPLVENGTVPARTKLEREYERQRLQSEREIQIQELLVRGFSPQHVARLIEQKELLSKLTLFVPEPTAMNEGLSGAPSVQSSPEATEAAEPAVAAPPKSLASMVATKATHEHDSIYSIEKMEIIRGQSVLQGETICDLGLHTDLYLEGHAFEQDTPLLTVALQEQRPLTALFETAGSSPDSRAGLKIRYIENRVDTASRAVHFYVPMKNEVLRDLEGDNGRPYRAWKYRPGQKVRILVPSNLAAEQIVLPVEAVTQDGPDSYVFRSNGELLERVAVIVEARDPRRVLIANDGAIFPGEAVAMNQAYQLNLALKSQQSGGGDGGHHHDHDH